MKTIEEILNHCKAFLEKKQVANPKLQAELVIAAALQCKRLDLYMDFHRPVTSKEASLIKEWIRQRGDRKPLGYIEKKVSFFGTEIQLNGDVLIPRMETEILVEKIAKSLENQDLTNKSLVDVCTGSGCIAIALKKRFPSLIVSGLDISEKALSLAKENAKLNGVEVSFQKSDMLQSMLKEKIDYIVSNPPYVTEKEFEDLEPEVKNFEPKLALVAGADGLDLYKKLKNQILALPEHPLKIWLEMGHTQGESLEKLFTAPGFVSKKIYPDYSSKDRFFFLERSANNRYSNV